MKKVSFEPHAIKRLNERLNFNIRSDAVIDISECFVKANTYMHHTYNVLVEAWVSKTDNILLIVVSHKNLVKTVMTEGHVVDAVYRIAKTKKLL